MSLFTVPLPLPALGQSHEQMGSSNAGPAHLDGEDSRADGLMPEHGLTEMFRHENCEDLFPGHVLE